MRACVFVDCLLGMISICCSEYLMRNVKSRCAPRALMAKISSSLKLIFSKGLSVLVTV